MNKKIMIAICLILLVLIIILIKFKNKNEISKNEKQTVENLVITYDKDETTGEYVVYRDGEEIGRVADESEIKVYIDNPDYDPKLLPFDIPRRR